MPLTTIAARLQELRLKRGMTLRDLESQIDGFRTYSQLGKYETRPDMRIGKKVLERLAAALGTTVDYLENGTKQAIRTPFNNMPPRHIITDNKGKELTLKVPVRAQAGYRQNIGDAEYLGELKAYSLPGFEHGTYRIFEVAGDSMQPTIAPGDDLICEYVESPADIKEGEIYVIVTSEGICVKRIVTVAIERGLLIIESDNKEYKPDAIPVAEVLEVWAYRKKITV